MTDVAALPDTASFFSSDIKVYTTKVRIDSPLPGLRPGMNAEVTIEVNQLDKVLTVPVLAVLEFSGKDHVTKKVDGRFVQTEVELACRTRNSSRSRAVSKEGEIVAMSPVSLMTEEEKREAFGSTGKAMLRDWSKEETADGRGRQGEPPRRRAGQGADGASGKAGPRPARARRRQGRARWVASDAAVDGQPVARGASATADRQQ